MVVSEFSNGISVSLRSRVAISQSVDRHNSKRGKVTRFSEKSASRLRHLLLLLNADGRQVYALTLTVPGFVDSDGWYLLVERLRKHVTRLGLGMIWRVELQRRGVPHLHCVLVCDTIDDVFGVWYAWVRSCDSVVEGLLPCDLGFIGVPWSCHAGFLTYGFSCRLVSGKQWYSYVAAHAAKHKQSQLGWQGRQWGIINKSALSFHSSNVATVDDQFLIFLCRCLRKRFRFSRISITKKGSYDFFISPVFIQSAKRWYYRELPF